MVVAPDVTSSTLPSPVNPPISLISGFYLFIADFLSLTVIIIVRLSL